ncbi:MAG TPA: hypothetical protein VJR47_06490 [Stellaceae bacterium]|nr:hypothetical protein [Stellaceae bacterium]
MKRAIESKNALILVGTASPHSRDHHLVEGLIERLPGRIRTPMRWLRRPSSRWARLPTGVLLIGGGFLSVLPLFGLWMLPLGLMLLAEDVPPLRRARRRILERIARRWPHWFAAGEAAPACAVPSAIAPRPSETRRAR